MTSSFAQQRIPHLSDYCTSKHALNRLVEFIALCVAGVLNLFTTLSLNYH